jgi:phosphatidylcholine synthase
MARRGRTAHKGKAVRKKTTPKRDRGIAKTIAAPDASSASAIVFSIHVFTALGAACALLALIAATRAEWVTMFAWLGVALLIDGVDGTLARHFRVAERLPRWSGDVLDLVVDFTTYVLVPAYALAASGLLPQQVAIPLAVAIVVSAAIYCADREMKLPDNSFRGFPILWNAIAFHLFVIKFSPWVTAAIVAVFVILTFAPYRTIHPLRMPHMLIPNAPALLAWALLALYALLRGLDPGVWFAAALNAIGLYFLVAGLVFPADQAKPER